MNNAEQPFALEAFLPYRLMRIAELVSQDFSSIYRRKYGLNRPEWRCLATLGQFGRTTAKAIGEHSAMHKTKVSRAVAELERRGWLKRKADPQDRRVEHLSLTDDGRTAFRSLVPLAGEFEANLQSDLGDRRIDQFLAGLEAMEQRFGIPSNEM
ncbi:MAG TPA: MarR family transcriptional regulator [Afifellaceae bacterium]|nr:MarR family transcriptional regulator [Afifellaceae bacterium]